jgi:ElaB/YqjD/DUF883 family membrane-anchored ribosome-binding protein
VDPSTEDVRADIEATRDRMGGTLEAIGDRVSPGRVMERRANRVRNWGRSVSDRVMGTGQDVRSSLGDRAGNTSEALASVPDRIQSQAAGNPLIAGAIAFGVGFMIGGALPASQKEQELSERAVGAAQPLKDELQQAGKEAAEHLKEPAREAVDQLKATATSGVEEVKGKAQEGVDRTKDAASSENS